MTPWCIALATAAVWAVDAPVPTGHRWQVVVDAAAVVQVPGLLDGLQTKPGARFRWAMVQRFLGIDVRSDLDRLVLSGSDARRSDAVLIATGRLPVARWDELLRRARDHRTETTPFGTQHHWTRLRDGASLCGVMSPGWAVVGETPTAVAAGCAALAASPRPPPTDLAAALPEGAVTLASAWATDLPSWQHRSPRSAVVRGLAGCGATLGYHEGHLVLAVRALPADPAQTQPLLRTLDDLRLAARAAAGDADDHDPLRDALLESCTVVTDGPAMVLRARVPLALVIEALGRHP
jgi:hypothetical protein